MIYLARHGETDWNLFKRCNGVTDVFLNRTGIKQAEQLKEKLKNAQLDLCICSSQARAKQFSDILFQGPVIYDNRLTEINCGEFEGMEETPEMMKALWQAVQTGDRGTEKFQDFVKRNQEVYEWIQREHNDKNVLVVTHAANVRVLNYYFQGKPEHYDFTKRVTEIGEYISY